MVKKDNPAGRLHEILTQARMEGNRATIEVWATVLGATPADKTEILRCIFRLHELFDEVKEKISRMEGLNTQLHLSHFPQLEAVVKATNYDAAWDNYKPQLSEAAMLNLAYCAEALAKYGESPISSEELSELLRNVDELSEKIWNSSSNDLLKVVISDLLEAIRRAIREYRVRGAEGLKKELAYCIGTVVQNHGMFKANEATEEVGAFGKLLSKINALVTFALKLKELGFDFTAIAGLLEKK